MLNTFLLSEEIQDGRRLLDKIKRSETPTSEAFWFFDVEEKYWSFNLAFPRLHGPEQRTIYRAVHEATDQLPLGITNLDMRIVDADSPIARAVTDLVGESPH